jgi:hypothetical protein
VISLLAIKRKLEDNTANQPKASKKPTRKFRLEISNPILIESPEFEHDLKLSSIAL